MYELHLVGAAADALGVSRAAALALACGWQVSSRKGILANCASVTPTVSRREDLAVTG